MKINKRRQPTDFAGAAESEPDPGFASESGFGFRTLDAPDPRLAAPTDPLMRRAQVARQAEQPPALASEPAATARSNEQAPAPSGWAVYLIATVVFALWACAPIAFALGARSGIAPFSDNGFALAVFALLVIGPGALIFIAAYLIRQGQGLAAEARRARAMTEELVSPALIAAGRASDVVRAVRAEIHHAGEAADEARETLLALRDALATEAEHLAEAAAASTRNAQGLVEALSRERTEMGTMSQSLDAQAVKVADTITQQARMVAEASDLAETQLREAEALLAARAADLAAAAGEANDAARTAGEDLTRHIARLETAGLGVAQQINAVEMGLSEQRAALFTVAQALKGDHETFAAAAESQTTQLGEFISQARLSAVEMSDRAVKGGDTLRDLLSTASDQIRELSETAKAEREEFGQSTLQSMGAVSEAAAKERALLEEQTRAAIDSLAKAAEETRTAASQHAETARQQVDQLSEAAFSAGQKANQVFEARLAEARELIDHSAKMVEQAGAATAQKLEEGAAAARATLSELQGMMSAIEAKAAQMPLQARGQAEQVRIAVSDSMEELMEQARRAAEETEAIDAAFQSRVRRNYDMLSEAVRLMGSVAGPPQPLFSEPEYRERPVRQRPVRGKAVEPEAPEAAPEPAAEQSAPETSATPEPPTPEAPVAEPAVAESQDEPGPIVIEPPPLDAELESNDLLEPSTVTAPTEVEAQARATGAALRPRLRLTPTATDEEFSNVFGTATGKAPDDRGEEGWTWKDLLTSIDEAEGDVRTLDTKLTAEIIGMGIDPAALLPKGRIEEIAAAVISGDAVGSRQVVRKLAPAATRRIARRLSGDAKLKAQVDAYLDHYEGLLQDAAERDHAGLLTGTLLGSEGGRAYLLLDAALSD